MNTIIKTLSIIALTSAAVAPLSAQEKDINPWQDCGIGSMIFPENGTASAISNIIWDSGTTAVTSATLSEESCKGERVQTALFINETYEQLEENIVKGAGEHLDTLASLMSCSSQNIADLRGAMALDIAADNFSTQSTQAKAETLFNNAETVCSAS